MGAQALLKRSLPVAVLHRLAQLNAFLEDVFGNIFSVVLSTPLTEWSGGMKTPLGGVPPPHVFLWRFVVEKKFKRTSPFGLTFLVVVGKAFVLSFVFGLVLASWDRVLTDL